MASPKGGSKSNDGPTIVCRMMPSRWNPHTVVPTYYVAARTRKGFFATLNDAIAFAEPYSRIEVTTGKYFENVIVNKPIEIGTDGNDDASAEFYSRGATFTFQATEAFVEGLCIRTGDTNHCAVHIDSGAPKIVHCDIESIEVDGDAKPIIEDNKIVHGKLHGLTLLGSSGGVYKGNVIESHCGYGIKCQSNGTPLFSHNKITLCEQGQVLVQGIAGQAAAGGLFTFNRIVDETARKLQKSDNRALQQLKDMPVRGIGDPVNLLPHVVARGRILDLDGDDADKVEDAALLDTRCCVEVGPNSKPSFSGNSFVGSMAIALSFRAGAHGLVDGNRFVGNRGWGISVEGSDTKPIITNNIISENGRGGIRVSDGAGGEIRKNTVAENRGPQILVMRGCDALVVRNNDICSVSRVGIVCKEGGNGLFLTNTIHECYVGIRVESEGNPTIRDNILHLCHVGVAVVRHGRGVFDENELANNRGACFVVTKGSHPYCLRNRMLASEHAVIVQQRGKGLYESNHIKDNNLAQIVVRDKGSCPTFVNNTIADGREEGALISDFATPEFRHNQFTANVCHVTVRTSADPVIDQNLMSKAVRQGCIFTQRGMGIMTRNVVEKSFGDAVEVSGGASPTIRGNVIQQNHSSGLHLADAGPGVFEKNDLVWNGQCNVLVTGGGAASKEAEAVVPTKPKAPATPQRRHRGATPQSGAAHHHGQSEAGTAGSPEQHAEPVVLSPPRVDPYAPESGFPLVRANWIVSAAGSGILASSNGRCLLIGNHISDNVQAAAKVTTGARLIFLANVFDHGEGCHVADDGSAVLVANRFIGTKTGVQTGMGARVQVFWNSFVQCGHGMLLGGGQGYVFENTLRGCQVGIASSMFNRAIVLGNVIRDGPTGLALLAKSKCHAVNNLIVGNSDGIVIDGEACSALVEHNNILKQKNAGVVVRNGHAVLSRNTIAGSPTNVVAEGASQVVVSLNLITGTQSIGISCASRGRVRADANLIHRCVNGITSASHGCPTVRDCVVQYCETGLLAWMDGHADVATSIFQYNRRNVAATLRGNPTLKHCLLRDALDVNASFSGKGAGHFTECVVMRARKSCGVLVTNEAHPVLIRCLIAGHTDIGTISEAAKLYEAAPVKTEGAERRHSQARHTHHHPSQSRRAANDTPQATAITPRQQQHVNAEATRRPESSSEASPTTDELDLADIQHVDDDEELVAAAAAALGASQLTVTESDVLASGHMMASRAVSLPFALVAAQSSARVASGDDSQDISRSSSRGVPVVTSRFQKELNSTSDRRIGCGVMVDEGGEGLFEDCIIEHNSTGIKIVRRGGCTFLRCVVEHQLGHGVIASIGARGVLKDCTVRKNTLMQCLVSGSDTTTKFCDCLVSDGIHNGFLVDLGASPTIEGAVISGMNGFGVLLSSKSDATVSGCKISRCQYGLGIRQESKGTVDGCEVFDVAVHGILVEDFMTMPTISECALHDCTGHGILVTNRAAPRIANTVMYANVATGLAVSHESTPTATANRMFANSEGGVLVDRGSRGTFTGNQIHHNFGPQISVSGAKPTFLSTCVFDGEANGVEIDGVGGTFRGLRVWGHRQHGIYIDGGRGSSAFADESSSKGSPPGSSRNVTGDVAAVTHFDLCDIQHSGDSGVHVRGRAVPEFSHCLFMRNAGAGFDINYGGSAKLTECLSKSNHGPGIDLSGAESRAEATGCVFAASLASSGAAVAHGAVPFFSRCLFTANCLYGIACDSSAKGIVSDCVLFDNQEANVFSASRAAPMIRESIIADGSVGVFLKDAGGAFLVQNFFTGSLTAGVRAESGATPNMESCVISDLKHGTGIQDAAQGEYTRTHIIGCHQGVEFQLSSSATVSESDVRDCVTGVYFEDCAATFSQGTVAGSAKVGVQVASGGIVNLEKCKIYRSKTGILTEGTGSIKDCEAFNNHDGIVIDGGDGLIVDGNTVFDASNVGVWIKDGRPSIMRNNIFDNTFASVMVDGGLPKIEENRIFFARDEGAIVNNCPATVKPQKNLERNAQSPNWEKTPTDRQLEYYKRKPDEERQHPTFRRAVRAAESRWNTCVDVFDNLAAILITVGDRNGGGPLDPAYRLFICPVHLHAPLSTQQQVAEAARRKSLAPPVATALPAVVLPAASGGKKEAAAAVGAAPPSSRGGSRRRSSRTSSLTGAADPALPTDRTGKTVQARQAGGVSFAPTQLATSTDVRKPTPPPASLPPAAVTLVTSIASLLGFPVVSFASCVGPRTPDRDFAISQLMLTRLEAIPIAGGGGKHPHGVSIVLPDVPFLPSVTSPLTAKIGLKGGVSFASSAYLPAQAAGAHAASAAQLPVSHVGSILFSVVRERVEGLLQATGASKQPGGGGTASESTAGGTATRRVTTVTASDQLQSSPSSPKLVGGEKSRKSLTSDRRKSSKAK